MRTEKSGSGVTSRTSVSLTHEGRGALDRYTVVLRQLLEPVESAQPRPAGG